MAYKLSIFSFLSFLFLFYKVHGLQNNTLIVKIDEIPQSQNKTVLKIGNDTIIIRSSLPFPEGRDGLGDYLTTTMQDFINKMAQNDPFSFPDLPFKLKEPLADIDGFFGGVNVWGLSTMKLSTVNANLLGFTVDLGLTMEYFEIEGIYDIKALIDHTKLDGYGICKFSIENPEVTANFQLGVENLVGQITVTEAEYKLKFDSISTEFEGLTINDEVVDWADFNEAAKPALESYEESIHEHVKNGLIHLLNQNLNGTTLVSLIGGRSEISIIKSN